MKRIITILIIISYTSIYGQVSIYKCSEIENSIQITCDTSGLLKIELQNIDNTILLQQYRWNRWITLDTLNLNKINILNYETLLPIHSENNLIRLKDESSSMCKNTNLVTIELNSTKKRMELETKIIGRTIEFSTSTAYEIYDSNGKLLIEGIGKTIDTSSLIHNAVYYLNYDNRNEKFVKK